MKVYSNQLVSEDIIPFPSGIQITNNEWWFIYNQEMKEIASKPIQCSAIINSPLTVVVADTLQECEEYISTNELILPEYLKEN
jgi:hypothetical protein